MNYKELLYNKDKVLTFYPELAVILNKFDQIESKRISEETGELKKPDKTGLNKAIFLNQLNYWIELNEQAGINFKDGYYWSYSSYPRMIERDFPYWSVDTLKRAVTSLEKYGIVISANYNSMKMDKKKWYRIDYKRLQEVIDIVKHHDELANSDVNAICTDVDAKCTDDEGNVSRAIKENRYNKDYSSKENNDKDCTLSSTEEKTLPSSGKGIKTSATNNINILNINNIPSRTTEQKEVYRKQKQKNRSEKYRDEDVPQILYNEFNSLYGEQGNILEDHDICLTMAVIAYYFKQYREHMGEQHIMISAEYADQFMGVIIGDDSPLLKADVEEKDELRFYQDMIDEFFKSDLGQRNGKDFDHHIWLFFSERNQDILCERVKQKWEEQEYTD